MVAGSISRRGFLAGAAGLAALPLLGAASEPKPFIGRDVSAKAGAPVARLKVADPSRIKALQLTDVHFFCPPTTLKRDEQTIENLPRLVEHTQPDLLLVTGDLWHDNPNGQGREFMEFAVDKITSLGRPWLFVWGNHDKLDDYAAGHEFLSAAKHSLYAGGGTGGCYRVEVGAAEGEACFEFVCVNSSAEGCDEHTRQFLAGLAAERGEARRVPAMGITHIPLKQHFEAWRSAEASGISLEGVHHQRERGATLPAWKQACDLRMCIAGHDHVNNFSGMADGVVMCYGHSTGVAGYGGDRLPKGAKLYTINAETGRVDADVHFPDGSTWRPEPGWRTADVLDIPWDTVAKKKAQEETAAKSAA